MSRYRLTVTPPDGSPVVRDVTILAATSAYGAMVILMNADPDFDIKEPVPYLDAREFADKLVRSPRKWEMKHGPTGFVFSIDGQE